MIPRDPIKSRTHWEYYLALEKDLLRTSRFAHFSLDNYDTYSTEFTILLLAFGSEVDVVAKEFCKFLHPDGQRGGMKDYRATIIKAYPKFWTLSLSVPRFGITLRPWNDWEHDQELDWWGKYNSVKHERAQAFKEGNLRHALYAAGSLFSLLLYYFRQTDGLNFILEPPSKLFASGKYVSLDPNARLWAYELPDEHVYPSPKKAR